MLVNIKKQVEVKYKQEKKKEDGLEDVEVENLATKKLKPLSTPGKPLLSFRNLQTYTERQTYKKPCICVFSPHVLCMALDKP